MEISEAYDRIKRGEFERAKTNVPEIIDYLVKEFPNAEDGSEKDGLARFFNELAYLGSELNDLIDNGDTTQFICCAVGMAHAFKKHRPVVEKLLSSPALQIDLV